MQKNGEVEYREETKRERLQRTVRMCEAALRIPNGPDRMYEDAILKLDRALKELNAIMGDDDWGW